MAWAQSAVVEIKRPGQSRVGGGIGRALFSIRYEGEEAKPGTQLSGRPNTVAGGEPHWASTCSFLLWWLGGALETSIYTRYLNHNNSAVQVTR